MANIKHRDQGLVIADYGDDDAVAQLKIIDNRAVGERTGNAIAVGTVIILDRDIRIGKVGYRADRPGAFADTITVAVIHHPGGVLARTRGIAGSIAAGRIDRGVDQDQPAHFNDSQDEGQKYWEGQGEFNQRLSFG